MALSLQCLCLLLLGALQTKAEDSSPTPNLRPSLRKVPLQPDFQDDQFQGTWYALAVADTTIQNGNETQLTMYSVNYELQEDHSFRVNTTMLRNEACEHSTETLVENAQSGQYTFDSFIRKRGILSYIMRVAATDYNHFAIVYVEKNVKFKWYFESTLYGRTKELSPELKERFVNFTTSVDFMENNIAFPVPIGNDQLGEQKELGVHRWLNGQCLLVTSCCSSCHHCPQCYRGATSSNACERAGRPFLRCSVAHPSPQKPCSWWSPLFC